MSPVRREFKLQLDKCFELLRNGEDEEFISGLTNLAGLRPPHEDVVPLLKQLAKECCSIGNKKVTYICMRTVFEIFDKTEFKDFTLDECTYKEMPFYLYGMLSSRYHYRYPSRNNLLEIAIDTLTQTLAKNDFANLIPSLRALNLYCKKHCVCSLDVPLDKIYTCLQSHQIGARDETLLLYRLCTTDMKVATKHFELITNRWPWTNKNKYYLLSVILTNHKLEHLTKLCDVSVDSFFKGLRTALHCKDTSSASQGVIKEISKQNNQHFLQCCSQIIRSGDVLVNFHAQWYQFILQKDELYQEIDLQLSTSYYDVFLLYMFLDQIRRCEDLLNETSQFLVEHYSGMTTEAQVVVFKFFVANLPHLDFTSSLEFIGRFLMDYRSTDSSQTRSVIIGKLLYVFNCIAKLFRKPNDVIRSAVKLFFTKLLGTIVCDLSTATSYQPLIFSLKTLHRILQAFYTTSNKNISKSSVIEDNQNLGLFLIDDQVFQIHILNDAVFCFLRSEEHFEDAIELAQNIIKEFGVQRFEDALVYCYRSSESTDIHKVVKCPIFAKVALRCLPNPSSQPGWILFSNVRKVRKILQSLKRDPLSVCKTQGHIFGHMGVINEVLLERKTSFGMKYDRLLRLVNEVVESHLRMLNVASREGHSTAASFQVMDESLDKLVKQSAHKCSNEEECRKFLLLSFWMNLKACCEVATTIGCIHANNPQGNLKLIKRCLNVSIAVLIRCRHKGAIEAAGVTLGKLVKCLSTEPVSVPTFQLLAGCLNVLFENVDHISTTRRGAGLTVMFLHLIKNGPQKNRPLFRKAMALILDRVDKKGLCTKTPHQSQSLEPLSENFDNVDALMLHYLCVIVKDTELRDIATEYYDKIMSAAINRIDDPEWTVCNAALLLFGALVPKIVGQKISTESTKNTDWEPTEVTFMEISAKLPESCELILSTCESHASMRKVILFLEFFSNVEYLNLGQTNVSATLKRLRAVFWSFLSHKCEKVRKLAGICFVRSHDSYEELPKLLLQMSDMIFKIHGENFFQGLLLAMGFGIKKMCIEYDATMSCNVDIFLASIRRALENSYTFRPLTFYTRAYLADLFHLIKFKRNHRMFKDIMKLDKETTEAERTYIGFDLFNRKLVELQLI